MPDQSKHDTTSRSMLSDQDIHLFNEGTHYRLYNKLGAHFNAAGGQRGTSFAVWAPNARHVSVIGDFNDWSPGAHPLTPRAQSGIWHGVVPDAQPGQAYKYHIESHQHGYTVDKADPFGFQYELPPRTASIIADINYRWSDEQWMTSRRQRQRVDQPMSIYEVHLGSWMRVPEESGRPLSYREIAPKLIEHVRQCGFTHVEFMPVMQHPFTGSWGYQITGYFAPMSQWGTAEDLMYLIDQLHQADVGVILDWVPSHFPSDEHGLCYFDGTHLYEHEDPRQGYHPDWGSLIFNYGRPEVRSFLLSNAVFWLDRFHADGLRVDAVASMLYLDYSRKEGEWIPNRYGGRENIEAIDFLRQLNTVVYGEFDGIQMTAEESTAWPMVSRPTYVGGLGFGYKWDMGWMNDTLEYMRHDSVHRKFHHNQLTFRAVYQFSENYVLPLSHDEVVHGKGSLLSQMPGDDWQRLANLRLLLCAQWMQPGKKLLFMGGEFGQMSEWSHDRSLDWHLLDDERHKSLLHLLHELNRVYVEEPALHVRDCEPSGFTWLESNDAENSVVSFLRHGPETRDVIIVVLNYTPVPRHNYMVGAPFDGKWQELLNSDAHEFGGSGLGNFGQVESKPVTHHEHPHSLTLTLPPLAAVVLKPAE